MVNAEGKELEKPSVNDDFSEKAHRDYAGASRSARANMKTLEAAMVREGFVPYPTEWWHFDAKNAQAYGLADYPITENKKAANQ